MPEICESHLISDKLRPRLVGRSIISVDIYSPKHHSNLDLLPLPRKITAVQSMGKKPLFLLDQGMIGTSLAMAGGWHFQPTNNMRLRLTIAKVKEDGPLSIIEDSFYLYYNDSRFGKVEYLANQEEANHFLRNVGPDLIDTPPTLESYIATLTTIVRPKMKVAAFLVDQSYFAGVGNYLRAEIMYASQVHPGRLVGTLTTEEISRLHKYTLAIINLSLQHGGLTISDYWDPEGAKGVYPCMVYKQPHDPYGRPVTKGKFGNGQNVYWVPGVQV